MVAPAYPGRERLRSVEETRLIRSRLGGRRIQRTSVEELDRYFMSHEASLLHFACHGAAGVDNDDVLRVTASDTLSSASLRALGGFKRLCLRRAPLVFLNACSVGRVNRALAGGAGFPRAFGDLGARAVVAPLWPVDDVVASRFVVDFYTAATAPGAPAVAEILRRFRERAYTNPGTEAAETWAAYTYFGDPLARLEPVRSA